MLIKKMEAFSLKSKRFLFLSLGAQLYERIRYGDGMGTRQWHAFVSEYRHWREI